MLLRALFSLHHGKCGIHRLRNLCCFEFDHKPAAGSIKDTYSLFMPVRVLRDDETHSNIHRENVKTQHNDRTRFKNSNGFDMAL